MNGNGFTEDSPESSLVSISVTSEEEDESDSSEELPNNYFQAQTPPSQSPFSEQDSDFVSIIHPEFSHLIQSQAFYGQNNDQNDNSQSAAPQ